MWWSLWFYICFSGIFLLMYPAFWILLKNDKWHPIAVKMQRVWAYLLLFLIGIRVKITYEEELDYSKTYIFCPNHSSYLDIPVMAVIIKSYFHFMAKAELAKIPIFGILFRDLHIPVNRSNRLDSFKATQKAEQNLKAGKNLVIFPEGTTSDVAPKLSRFKNGAFKLAKELDIEIVPVTILDNWSLFLADGKLKGKPGRSRVICHKPLRPGDFETENLLKEEVYHILEQTLHATHGSK